MIVEGFQDQGLTLPAPIFVETRFEQEIMIQIPRLSTQAGTLLMALQSQMTVVRAPLTKEGAHIWFNGLWE